MNQPAQGNVEQQEGQSFGQMARDATEAERQIQHIEQATHVPLGAGPAPSVGRIVHYWPEEDDGRGRSNKNPGPIAALVTRVVAHDTVNVTAFPDTFAGTVCYRSVVRRTHDGQRGVWDWPARI